MIDNPPEWSLIEHVRALCQRHGHLAPTALCFEAYHAAAFAW